MWDFVKSVLRACHICLYLKYVYEILGRVSTSLNEIHMQNRFKRYLIEGNQEKTPHHSFNLLRGQKKVSPIVIFERETLLTDNKIPSGHVINVQEKVWRDEIRMIWVQKTRAKLPGALFK